MRIGGFASWRVSRARSCSPSSQLAPSSSISRNPVTSRPACFCITSTARRSSTRKARSRSGCSASILRRVDLQAALANDEIMGTETVGGDCRASPADRGDQRRLLSAERRSGGRDDDRRTARERHAPSARRGGHLEGCDRRQARLRAAASHGVARAPEQQPPSNGGPAMATIPIDGIDTTRIRGQLMLYTPSYHADTDTAKGGLEWVIDRQRGRLVSGPHRGGKTRIPPRGFVLSFGGEDHSRAADVPRPEHSSQARCVVRSGRR